MGRLFRKLSLALLKVKIYIHIQEHEVNRLSVSLKNKASHLFPSLFLRDSQYESWFMHTAWH